MPRPPRIAFFPDSFHEANGVARTSRALVASAAKRRLPFFCIHAGPVTRWIEEGDGGRLELGRGRMSFALDHDLRHDLLLWRHFRRVAAAVRAFRADVVHITGPSDVGQLGASVAHRFGLPLVGSWHTNLHAYAECRIERRLRFVPACGRRGVAAWARRRALWATLQFYRLPSVLMAPNPELVDFLRAQTGKPTYLMRRGVDTTLFSPAKRDKDDGQFRLGLVGRLSSEKNLRLLPGIERALLAAGHTNVRFLIVGDGRERSWLEGQLQHADFTGVLGGDALARAYANMDLLVFPSETDTFGNVVLEALASGTPAVVSRHGGPKFIVRPGVSWLVASDERDFIDATRSLVGDRARHHDMRKAARRHALEASWDRVLDEVVLAYVAATNARTNHEGAPSC
jgi:phosphatidylinositol alpha 1,6-mannosyltransferase